MIGGRPVERQVLDVAALAAEEARVLLPQDAIPEDAHEERAYRSGLATGDEHGAAGDLAVVQLREHLVHGVERV